MFPVFIDDENGSSRRRSPRLRALKLLTIGVASLFAIGIMMMAAPVNNVRMIGFITAVPVGLIAVAVVWLLLSRLTATTTAKSKRGLDGLDMYSMIDRMVEDLDDDEAAYLQRRLDERDGKAKRDLSASLEELLDQRAEDRRQRG